METDQSLSRDNNFGLLRLLLASLVVVSHSAELIDGNRSREPLTQVFGTLSFGDVAVYGFFIISGYLITQSCVQRRSVLDFCIKRFFRIVPGYAVSFLICAFVLAPFVGAGWEPFRPVELLRLASKMVRLLAPGVPGSFAELPYPALNGSMWTISYEMRCYGFALLAGLLGLYARGTRFIYLAVIAGLFACVICHWPDRLPFHAASVVGQPALMLRLTALFGSGAVFYLFRKRIAFHWTVALPAGAALLVGLFFASTVELTFAVCGGYILFWIAFEVPATRASRAANKTDISYGLYLYAYPIQNLLLFLFGLKAPWLLTALSLPLACVAGILSWMLVEAPALGFAKRWIRTLHTTDHRMRFVEGASMS